MQASPSKIQSCRAVCFAVPYRGLPLDCEYIHLDGLMVELILKFYLRYLGRYPSPSARYEGVRQGEATHSFNQSFRDIHQPAQIELSSRSSIGLSLPNRFGFALGYCFCTEPHCCPAPNLRCTHAQCRSLPFRIKAPSIGSNHNIVELLRSSNRCGAAVSAMIPRDPFSVRSRVVLWVSQSPGVGGLQSSSSGP